MSETAEARLARLEQDNIGQDREIRDIKLRLDRSDEILTAIHKLAAQQEHILNEIKEHDERLRAVEAKPGKRWESIVAALIGAAITGGAALIGAQFIGQ